jgi:lipoprotein NlpI
MSWNDRKSHNASDIVFVGRLFYTLQSRQRRGIILRRIFVASILASLCAAAPSLARAAAYDDFARGLSANLQGESALALTSFSAAIAEGGLAPTQLPVAYRGRALAYLRLSKCELAKPDLDIALQLAPDDLVAVDLRAFAAACIGDFTLAGADYSTLIAKQPQNADGYVGRGRLRWRQQDFAGASIDLTQAAQLAPKNAYVYLWLELVRSRAGTLDLPTAANDAARFDKDKWPYPLLALFAGLATSDDVQAAASRGADSVVRVQRCQAHFYAGEWWLARNDSARAKAEFQAATVQCPTNFGESLGARAELARLN